MIVVTGATGKLGRLVVEGLIRKVGPGRVVAAVRHPEKAADMAVRGVALRRADYDDPASLAAALAGARKVLLISGNQVGKRVAQHKAVIDAVRCSGVDLFAYTSILRANTNSMMVAVEHRETEKLLLASGLPYLLLRNGWYIENFTEALSGLLAKGGFVGCAGQGRIAAASRADYAHAAVAALTGDRVNLTLELGGEVPFTMSQLASEVSAWAGRPLPYRNLSPDQYRQELLGAGVAPALAEFLVDTDQGIARGDLDTPSRELHRLLGRPPATLQEVLAGLPRPG